MSSYLTLHARRGRTTIVLLQETSTKVPNLIAQLAEVLVETKEASNEEVVSLRVAVQKKDGTWEEVTEERTSSLEDLALTDDSIVGYALGSEEFSYEEYEPESDSA